MGPRTERARGTRRPHPERLDPPAHRWRPPVAV